MTPCKPDPELWFSLKVEERRLAQRKCMGCHIIDTCRDGAIERQEEHGVWGAVDFTTERTRPAPYPIPHGTDAGYRAHQRRGQTPCDACRTGHSLARAIRKERKGRAA